MKGGNEKELNPPCPQDPSRLKCFLPLLLSWSAPEFVYPETRDWSLAHLSSPCRWCIFSQIKTVYLGWPSEPQWSPCFLPIPGNASRTSEENDTAVNALLRSLLKAFCCLSNWPGSTSQETWSHRCAVRKKQHSKALQFARLLNWVTPQLRHVFNRSNRRHHSRAVKGIHKRMFSGPTEINVVLRLWLRDHLNMMSASNRALTKENIRLACRGYQTNPSLRWKKLSKFSETFNVLEEKWEHLSLFAFNVVYD